MERRSRSATSLRSCRGRKSVSARSARPYPSTITGKLLDNADAVEGIVLLQKGDNSDTTLEGIHAKVKELNEHVLPPGVKIVPFLDRSDLLHLTTHTVLDNLTKGIILVVIILFLVSRQCPRRVDRRAHDTLRASVRLDMP